jgi:hypothetical protein
MLLGKRQRSGDGTAGESEKKQEGLQKVFKIVCPGKRLWRQADFSALLFLSPGGKNVTII